MELNQRTLIIEKTDDDLCVLMRFIIREYNVNHKICSILTDDKNCIVFHHIEEECHYISAFLLKSNKLDFSYEDFSFNSVFFEEYDIEDIELDDDERGHYGWKSIISKEEKYILRKSVYDVKNFYEAKEKDMKINLIKSYNKICNYLKHNEKH